MLCRMNLEMSGFEVAEASDGVEALTIIESFRPDVILLDGVMPVMDGWQTLGQIGKHPSYSQIPVILLTGSVRRQDLEDAISAGAVACVAKPFNPDELLNVVRSVLGL